MDEGTRDDPQAESTAMKPRLYRVIVPVSDIERAEAFYTSLLGIEGKRVSPGRHYFDCSGTILACFDPKADGDDHLAQPNPDHLYLAVDELEAVFGRARGLPCSDIDAAIETQPWGERCFYLADPFGNRLCMVDFETVFTG